MLKKIFLTIAFAWAGLLAMQAPVAAAIDPLCSAYNSKGECIAGACAGKAAQSSICKQAAPVDADTANPVSRVISVTANIIAIVSAVIAVIMIIIAGITMVTSQGKPESMSSARSRIIYSVVGLVVIALAWSITTYFANHLIK